MCTGPNLYVTKGTLFPRRSCGLAPHVSWILREFIGCGRHGLVLNGNQYTAKIHERKQSARSGEKDTGYSAKMPASALCHQGKCWRRILGPDIGRDGAANTVTRYVPQTTADSKQREQPLRVPPDRREHLTHLSVPFLDEPRLILSDLARQGATLKSPRQKTPKSEESEREKQSL
ncbi:hypothetical protein EYF80_010925 [Liparis tanakae]|uniref:Uncharacterized protein n=1 Tax=Liparis tanakae TaxID=230148 RepID=A0A4Z2ILN2_9TELE|nr:hypothetical protein EYF80_010925 [Liparis tanakae]